MQNISKQIRDYIEKESCLPEINADACIHSYFNQSDCQACVDSCPTQAWILSEESLGLNTNACDGCGQCIPTCPQGALSVEYPWIIRQFKGQSIALFSCELSNSRNNGSTLPCIHILGLRQILMLHKFGIKHLLVSTDECAECERCPAITIQQRVADLNPLLVERNKPPMKVLRSSAILWNKISNSDEVLCKGIKLSRRNFLRGDGQQYRRQTLMDDPLNLPESRTIPPGELLPAVNKTGLRWPWAPELDKGLCNYCDTCMNLCPTDALQFMPGDEESLPEYNLNPAKCNGCGICESACDLGAISINHFSISSTSTINLSEKRCASCGNNFHFSEGDPNCPEPLLCRICRKDNHNSRLFQIIQ